MHSSSRSGFRTRGRTYNRLTRGGLVHVRVRPGIFLLETRALMAEQRGDLTGAENLLRQAVRVEESLPISFGPPTIDKPTHELLGDS